MSSLRNYHAETSLFDWDMDMYVPFTEPKMFHLQYPVIIRMTDEGDRFFEVKVCPHCFLYKTIIPYLMDGIIACPMPIEDCDGCKEARRKFNHHVKNCARMFHE